MITTEARDAALDYLVHTNDDYARAKSYMLGIEAQKKTVLSLQSLDSIRKTVADKEAEAYASLAYKKWVENYQNAVLEYETIRNKRSYYTLIFECWRSEHSARKQGQII